MNRKNIFLASLSGILLTGSFPTEFYPDGNFSPLIWISLVPLLLAIRNLSPRNAFKTGMLCGVLHYLTLVYWITHTMHIYGNLPAFVCVPLLVLLSLYLSLYVALFSYSLVKLSSAPAYCLAVIPTFWVIFEYIRSYLFSGFPWGLLGYSQFNRLRIVQISDITGVYGVSFLIALTNAGIFLILLNLIGGKWREGEISRKLAIGSAALISLTLLAVLYYGNSRINAMDALMESALKKPIAVIQGNIPQSEKWDSSFQYSTTQTYIDLSGREKEKGAELIVWPETATPFYYLHDTRLTQKVQNLIHETGGYFLIGSPAFLEEGRRVDYYNSAYMIHPDGRVLGRYDKVHLVPFGEYVPLKRVLFFVDKMVEGIGDFCSGNRLDPLSFENLEVGVQICYEIIFPNLSRTLVQRNAVLLANITNDAWFGNTAAPYQHFAMAVLRAVENKRSLIRAANTGISGFVDPVGRVVGKTALFEKAGLTCEMPVLKVRTFYSRFGDLFVFAAIAAGVFMIVLKKVTAIRRNSH